MPANAPAKNPPEERLVNLVVALMATEQGLTKDTILTSVVRAIASRPRRERPRTRSRRCSSATRRASARLGVPIETIGDWADPDDLREARYRVPTAEYELPEDIVFTSAELALLNLAGGVWSESSMSDDARSGLRKIRALGISVDEPIIGYSPRISLREPSFAALQQAIEQSRVVTFPLPQAGRGRAAHPARPAARPRRVRGALARLRHRPRCRGRSHVPALAHRRRRRGHARQRSTPRCAKARGSARSRAWRRSPPATRRCSRSTPAPRPRCASAGARTPADQGIRVPFVDVHVFADELASYGPEVRVVEPAELRDQVIAAARGDPRTCTPEGAHDRAASRSSPPTARRSCSSSCRISSARARCRSPRRPTSSTSRPSRCARWSRSSR